MRDIEVKKQPPIAVGTTRIVEVVLPQDIVLAVRDENMQGYLLVNHGLKPLPKKGDKGKIVMTDCGAKGNHWKYLPVARREGKALLIKAQTADGSWSLHDHVPTGRIYRVDLDTVRTMLLHNLVTGVEGPCEVIDVYQDGKDSWTFYPTEMLALISDELKP